MDRALELVARASNLVARVDPRSQSAEGLRQGLLGLQAQIDRLKVLQARWMTEADARKVWDGTGARDLADWLAGATNSSLGEARRRAKLGAALGASPELSDAVAAGELSADAAEALHDAVLAPPEGADVSELVAACKGANPRQAKDAAERWKELHSPESEADAEERRHQARAVRSTAPVDGLVTTTVTLPTLQSRQFHQAITAAAGAPAAGDARTTAQRLADGLILLCDAYAKGEVTGGREKPTILITFPAESFEGSSDEPGVTAQGDRIPAHVVRRLAENAHLHRVVVAGSKILDLGMRVRFATDAQYQALVVRDRGCRWPGCHIPAAWCEIDHLVPFTEGGATTLDNLVMWCSHHHHEKHRPGVIVHGDAHDLQLQLVDGTRVHCPSPARTASAAA